MIKIKGISINELQIQMDFVGVLLFHEFPVTTIYSEKNIPIIKEWVDCNDDIDRYLIYKSSKNVLKHFLEGKLNHLSFIKRATDSLVYVVDEKNGKTTSVKIQSISQVPEEYLPSDTSLFTINDGVETKKIIDFFQLKEIKLDERPYIEHVKEISKSEHSDVFNLHLIKGKNISFGSIDTNVLGNSLLSFDNLYQEIALDHHFGKNRGDFKISKNDKTEKLEQSKTLVFLNEAASFSVFLKAKHSSQIDIFENKTELQKIAENLFFLFSITKEEDTLNENYLKFSDLVYKSYKHFLKNIIQNEVKLDLSWVNSKSTETYIEDFSLVKANNIIKNIESIHSETDDKFNVKGKFRAINCNTGYFTFIGLDDEHYNGYFDKLLKDGITLLNFTDLFDVVIERKITKDAGSQEPSLTDIITAYYDVED
ncbi:MAG: hypothetical protein V3V28_05745 [Polaribacter sp.]|uniref:hypothetical protein n=1 Tax=Polaribacter sp. TaxID=1920175 RepID=UPI002F35CB05